MIADANVTKSSKLSRFNPWLYRNFQIFEIRLRSPHPILRDEIPKLAMWGVLMIHLTLIPLPTSKTQTNLNNTRIQYQKTGKLALGVSCGSGTYLTSICNLLEPEIAR